MASMDVPSRIVHCQALGSRVDPCRHGGEIGPNSTMRRGPCRRAGAPERSALGRSIWSLRAPVIKVTASARRVSTGTRFYQIGSPRPTLRPGRTRRDRGIEHPSGMCGTKRGAPVGRGGLREISRLGVDRRKWPRSGAEGPCGRVKSAGNVHGLYEADAPDRDTPPSGAGLPKATVARAQRMNRKDALGPTMTLSVEDAATA